MLALILQLQHVHKLAIGIDGLWGMHLQCALGDQLNSSTQVNGLDVMLGEGLWPRSFLGSSSWVLSNKPNQPPNPRFRSVRSAHNCINAMQNELDGLFRWGTALQHSLLHGLLSRALDLTAVLECWVSKMPICQLTDAQVQLMRSGIQLRLCIVTVQSVHKGSRSLYNFTLMHSRALTLCGMLRCLLKSFLVSSKLHRQPS